LIHVFVISLKLDCLADVLSEDTVLKWYKGGHAAKGKSVFLEQMKKMVEWLQSAEEGKYVFQIFTFRQQTENLHMKR
jgi:hypothetical protein